MIIEVCVKQWKCYIRILMCGGVYPDLLPDLRYRSGWSWTFPNADKHHLVPNGP